jgi:hypothetical protein
MQRVQRVPTVNLLQQLIRISVSFLQAAGRYQIADAIHFYFRGFYFACGTVSNNSQLFDKRRQTNFRTKRYQVTFPNNVTQ